MTLLNGSRYCLPLVLITGLTGCVTLDMSNGATGERDSQFYLGLVHVQQASKTESIIQNNHAAVGLWAQARGIGAGYKSVETLSIPRKCQVTFVIDTKAKLETALALVKTELAPLGERLCVIDTLD